MHKNKSVIKPSVSQDDKQGNLYDTGGHVNCSTTILEGSYLVNVKVCILYGKAILLGYTL